MVHDRNAGQDTTDCSNPSPKNTSQLKRVGYDVDYCKGKEEKVILSFNRVVTDCPFARKCQSSEV